MNEFEKNNASELLTQLLDGELESANEPVLFSAMATDKDLFDELKQHLAIREAIRKDTEAFTPPPETVNAVFTSLGYRAPGLTPLPSAIIPKSEIWGKYLKRAVPFALLLVGLVGSYSIFKSGQEVDSTTSKLLKPDTKIEVASLNTVKANLPVILSSEKNKTYSGAVIIKKTANKKQAISTDLITDLDELSKETAIQLKSDTKIGTVNVRSDEFNHFQPSRNSNIYPVNYQMASITPLKIGGSDNLKFYFKNTSGFNSEPVFMNITFGISFLSKGNLKIGLEGGQQQYSVKVTDINDVVYETSKTISWLGAAFRYEAEELSFYTVTPFAQVTMGGVGFGNGKYLAKYLIGVEIIPFGNNIGLNCGYEGTNLWYSTLGNPNTSSTQGFSLGLSWKF
jgi:hypothetical protein